MTAQSGYSFKEVSRRAESLDFDDEEDQHKTKKNPFDFDDSDHSFLDADSKWVSQADVQYFLKQSRGIKFDDEDDKALGEAWGGSEYSISDRPCSETDPAVKSACRLKTTSAELTDFKNAPQFTQNRSPSTSWKSSPSPGKQAQGHQHVSSVTHPSSQSTSFSSSKMVSAASVRNQTPVPEKTVPTNKTVLQHAATSISDAISSTPQISVIEYNKLRSEVSQLRKDLQVAKKGQHSAMPVAETVRRIMRGQPYSLEMYKSLTDKLHLLDCALQRHDGNAILAAVLFLKRTIKKSKFLEEIQRRPKAARHFCKYLEAHFDFEELAEVYRFLGLREEAAMLRFRQAVKSKDPSERLRKLEAIMGSDFSTSVELADDTANLQEYVRLLDLQIKIENADSRAELERRNIVMATHPRQASLPLCSVIVTLYYCCRYHYSEPESTISSPATVRKQFQISDKQFEWTALPARAKLYKWKDIDEILTGKGWFGSVKMRSCIGFDRVVELLHRSGSPIDILSKYLKLVEEPNKRLTLATKYKCHDVAIETLFAQKDRQKLNEYRGKLDRYSPEQTKITNYLRNSQVKWKN